MAVLPAVSDQQHIVFALPVSYRLVDRLVTIKATELRMTVIREAIKNDPHISISSSAKSLKNKNPRMFEDVLEQEG